MAGSKPARNRRRHLFRKTPLVLLPSSVGPEPVCPSGLPSAVGPAGRRRYGQPRSGCGVRGWYCTTVTYRAATFPQSRVDNTQVLVGLDTVRMNLLRRQITLLLAGLTLGLAVSVQVAIAKKDKRESATSQMDGQKRALHALNRLAFGPRPGDVERVAAMGVDKWIDQQLHPDKIDDHALDARLEQLRTLRMSTRRSEEHTSELQSPDHLVCRLLLEKKNTTHIRS